MEKSLIALNSSLNLIELVGLLGSYYLINQRISRLETKDLDHKNDILKSENISSSITETKNIDKILSSRVNAHDNILINLIEEVKKINTTLENLPQPESVSVPSNTGDELKLEVIECETSNNILKSRSRIIKDKSDSEYEINLDDYSHLK